MANPAPAADEKKEAASASFGQRVRCPLCGHLFHPGEISGYLYCPRCGRRFHTNPVMEETATITVSRSGAEPEYPQRLASAAALDASGGEEVIERIGDYDILGEIARGGMGVVYKARQRTLKRLVALKVLRGGEGATEDDLARFLREAKAAASLSHPNIVPIHELSVDKGRHFFTMDYIDGTPLDRILEKGPLPPYSACEIIETIARAIHYAHEHGIIHRDLKPANIIIDRRGRPLVTDFGLAINLLSDVHSQRMTRTGAVMGTIPYIPPEQAAGKIELIDTRSDVYALGAVLYEMLTGRPPFQGETQYDLLRRVISQEPTSPRKINPRIHPDAETICLKCLEKERRLRYPSAEALADDCRAFLHGEVLQARPVSPYRRFLRYMLRNRVPVALAAGIMALALALLSYGWMSQRKIAQKEAEAKMVNQTLEVFKEKAEKSGRELQRYWRQEFGVGFEKGWLSAANPDQAHRLKQPWVDRRLVQWSERENGIIAIESETPGSRDKPLLPTRGAFGIPFAVPIDFNFSLRVMSTSETLGVLVVFIGADRDFRRRDMTQTLVLAPIGKGGAKLFRGEAMVVSEPSFDLTPGVWHRLEAIRSDGVLHIMGNGKEILKSGEYIPPRETEATFFAVAAQNGTLCLDDISLAVLGMSPAMVKSLLEVATNLAMLGDYPLALTLYERVARENIDLPFHLSALRGYARCRGALGGNRAAILEDCKQLVQRMRLGRQVTADEENYLCGLTLSESKNQIDLSTALNYFELARHAAIPPAEDLFSPQDFWLIGPFPAIGDKPLQQHYPPESEFQAQRVYEGKNGTVHWTRLEAVAKDGRVVTLPGEIPQTEDAIFYVYARFYSRQTLPVLIETGSDDGLALWVNGNRLLEKDVMRTAKPADDITESLFHEGDNTILMKIYNQKGGAAFSLNVRPRRVPPFRLSIYGLLAQLESAIVFLKSGDINGAKERLAAMQREGTLEALGQSVYAEHLRLGGPLAFVLEQIDRMLNKGDDPLTPWSLLDAMQTVYPRSAKDLAARYHLLGNLFRSRRKSEEALAAYQKAIALLPGWYLPYFDRAVLFAQVGDDTKCAEAFAEATALFPDSVDLQIAIAAFWLEEVNKAPRNPQLARDTAAIALHLSQGRNPAAWEVAARAFLACGAINEAQDAVQQAIALEDTPARRNLQKRIAEAARKAKEAPQTTPADLPLPPPKVP